MKHTPGPWKLFKDSGREEYDVVGRDSTPGLSRGIATVPFGYDEPVESEQHANANLIAAAPELLEAVHELERAVSAKFAHVIRGAVPADWMDINRQIMAARSAITKATK